VKVLDDIETYRFEVVCMVRRVRNLRFVYCRPIEVALREKLEGLRICVQVCARNVRFCSCLSCISVAKTNEMVEIDGLSQQIWKLKVLNVYKLKKLQVLCV
jgi:hypothetical protein